MRQIYGKDPATSIAKRRAARGREIGTEFADTTVAETSAHDAQMIMTGRASHVMAAKVGRD